MTMELLPNLRSRAQKTDGMSLTGARTERVLASSVGFPTQAGRERQAWTAPQKSLLPILLIDT